MIIRIKKYKVTVLYNNGKSTIYEILIFKTNTKFNRFSRITVKPILQSFGDRQRHMLSSKKFSPQGGGGGSNWVESKRRPVGTENDQRTLMLNCNF
jgi:hypothetical protein